MILPTVTYMQVGKITAYHKQVRNSKLKYIIMKNEENINFCLLYMYLHCLFLKVVRVCKYSIIVCSSVSMFG